MSQKQARTEFLQQKIIEFQVEIPQHVDGLWGIGQQQIAMAAAAVQKVRAAQAAS